MPSCRCCSTSGWRARRSRRTSTGNQCFGGSQTGFTWLNGPHTCSYTTLNGAGGGVTPVGNQYNPTDNVQTFLKYPYAPNFGAYNTDSNSTNLPFSFYIDAKIRL